MRRRSSRMRSSTSSARPAASGRACSCAGRRSGSGSIWWATWRRSSATPLAGRSTSGAGGWGRLTRRSPKCSPPVSSGSRAGGASVSVQLMRRHSSHCSTQCVAPARSSSRRPRSPRGSRLGCIARGGRRTAFISFATATAASLTGWWQNSRPACGNRPEAFRPAISIRMPWPRRRPALTRRA